MAQGGSLTPAQVRPGPCHQPGPGILRSRDPGGNTMPVCVSPCHCRGRGWSLHSHSPVTLLAPGLAILTPSLSVISASHDARCDLVTSDGLTCVSTRLCHKAGWCDQGLVCVSAAQSRSGNWLSVGECQVLTHCRLTGPGQPPRLPGRGRPLLTSSHPAALAWPCQPRPQPQLTTTTKINKNH